MSDPIEIYRTCGKCHGDGQFPNAYINYHGEVVEPEETYDCPDCAGSGRLVASYIHEDFVDAFDDLVNKVDDIREVVDEIKETVDLL